MKGLRVREGDLALTQAGRAETVEGHQKLMQHLSLWLREPLGVGYITVSFGTTLQELVGEANGDDVLDEAAAEVRRTLQVYQAHQFEEVKEAREQGTLANFSRAEILDRIGTINAEWLPGQNGIAVRAQIQTGAGEDGLVYAELGGE